MPSYPWLETSDVDPGFVSSKLLAMSHLGVPYEKSLIQDPTPSLHAQDAAIRERLRADGIDARPMTELIAMIAYLQRLGTDIKRVEPSELEGQ